MSNPLMQQEIDSELVQLSTFYLDDTLCGIDIRQVQEINEDIETTRVPLGPEYVIGIMNLRGQIVTVVNQAMKIGFRSSGITKKSRIIIVNSEDEYIGLLVDSIKEVVTVKENEIQASPPNLKGVQGKFFKGVVRTDSGELLAIIDINAVLTEE